MLCAGKLEFRTFGATVPAPCVCCSAIEPSTPKRGARLDAPEVSVYHVRDGKVLRSQMFHADSSAVAQFLTDAQSAAAAAIEERS